VIGPIGPYLANGRSTFKAVAGLASENPADILVQVVFAASCNVHCKSIDNRPTQE
jgi:hypothetical protein